jgi:uncharacterized protein YneF (UPF0154 family)
VRVSRWTLLWLLIVGVLAVIWIGVYVGWINPGNLAVSFFLIVLGLVVVAVLSLIGAVFLGMVISHRIMAGQGFTPFEEEMLKMRQEVRELHDRMDAILEKLGSGPDGKDRQR